jgi:hypothetical protein
MISPLTKKAIKKVKPSISEIEVALRLTNGHVAKAADLLSVEPALLRRKIGITPSLRKVMQDILDNQLDDTEEALNDLIKQRNPTAVTFKLRMQGRERGYTDKSTIEHEVGESTRSAAALIAAMRKAASQEEQGEVIEVTPTLIEEKSHVQSD